MPTTLTCTMPIELRALTPTPDTDPSADDRTHDRVTRVQ